MEWLDNLRAGVRSADEKATNALRYYMGPAYAPVNALANVAAMISPGEDFMDMYQQGNALMQSRTPTDAGMNALGMGAATIEILKKYGLLGMIGGGGAMAYGSGANRMDYKAAAVEAANRYGIPADLFLRQVGAESSWQENALSPKGAQGLAQLMPGTAAELGVDPTDPLQNLDGGARYLRQQYDTFGDWDLALAAYNAGPGAVRKYGGIPPYEETQNYVAKLTGGSQGGNALAGGMYPEMMDMPATNALAAPEPQPMPQVPYWDAEPFMNKRRFT